MRPLNLRLFLRNATIAISRCSIMGIRVDIVMGIVAGILVGTLMTLSSVAQSPSMRFIDAEGKTLADVPTVLHAERIYLPVDAVKTVFDAAMTQQYNLPRKRLTLKTSGKTLRLEMGKSTVSIDAGKQTLELSTPPRVIRGKPMLPVAFFTEVLPVLDDVEVLYNPSLQRIRFMPKTVWQSSSLAGAEGEWTVIIDPGHGGPADRGCESNTGLLEKDVVLALAKQLQLISSQHGYQARLTRETDVKKTQLERIQIANRNQGQLLLSFHCNASFSPQEKGIRIYLNNPKGQLRFPTAANAIQGGNRLKILSQSNFLKQSQEFAAVLQKELNFLTETPVVIAELPLVALSKAYMPAVLVELGYLSHADDSVQLANPEHIAGIAKAIARAIQTYRASVSQ